MASLDPRISRITAACILPPTLFGIRVPRFDHRFEPSSQGLLPNPRQSAIVTLRESSSIKEPTAHFWTRLKIVKGFALLTGISQMTTFSHPAVLMCRESPHFTTDSVSLCKTLCPIEGPWLS